jgi:hypothetical protein
MNALLWLFGFIFISSHHLSRAQDGGLDALRKNIRGEPGKLLKKKLYINIKFQQNLPWVSPGSMEPEWCSSPTSH